MRIAPLLSLLIAITCAAARAADVSVYALTKTQNFQQTSSAAPVLQATGGFSFGAIIDPATATSVTSATLRLPSATVVPFGPVPGFGPFAVAEAFDTQAAMDAEYGSGSYLFTIHAVSDGTKTPSLSLGAAAYPTTPRVTNFAAAQTIDWTQNFTLQWNAFAGGTSSDSIQLIILRKNGSTVFSTPTFGSTGALDGTATSTVIPANTLVPGETYSATLVFGNIITINIFAYGFLSGVPGVTAFAKRTDFPMKAPGTTPKLQISKGVAAGSYDLTWNADIGRSYDLVRSQDLTTWTRVALITATASSITRTDTPAASVKFRFYRLQEPP